MAYIGKTPTSGDFVLLDNLTASATASYTMQRNSVNFEPQSANHMIVSLNGTIQKPGSSFTISGSTITFASALTSSDAIDFILVLGNVNDVGVATSVVDSAITKGKLDLISTSGSPGLTVKGDGSSENGTIQLNCSQNSHGVKISSPAHSSGQSYELILPTGNVTADKFLKVASVSGSGSTGIGQLSFADAPSGGLIYVGGTSTSSNVAALTVDNVFTSTYENYFVIYDMTPSDNGENPKIHLRDTSPATITSSHYTYSVHGRDHLGNQENSVASNSSDFQPGQGQYGNQQTDYPTMVGYFYLNSPFSSTHQCNMHGNVMQYGNNGDTRAYDFALRMGIQTSIGGLRFSFSSGSVNNGDVKVYGLVNS